MAILAACSLPQNVRDTNRRIDTLASMAAVPGHVIAVLKNVHTDEAGDTTTSHTPVVVFTTREGTAVTAYCTSGLPNLADADGRDVTIHYSPADPAVFTLNPAAEHRSQKTDITVNVVVLLLAAATAIVGAIVL